MKTKFVSNDLHNIERFNYELDALLQGQPVDKEKLDPEDRRALDLAASLAGMELMPPQSAHACLRWRLIAQAHRLKQEADFILPLDKLHMTVSKIALVFLVVMVGLVFNNLAYLTSSNRFPGRTANATDTLIRVGSASGQDLEALSLQVSPKIVPTPTAPLTILASAGLPVSSTSQSSPGSTELSPTLIPVVTP